MNFNHYLFVNLVNDLIINLNDWTIPCNASYLIVMQAYEEFVNFDLNYDLSLYDCMTDFIISNEELYSSLRELAEKGDLNNVNH